ncbi:TRAP transporter small permease [Oceanispirochaeta crateris]|uniref:TRAP transporter small permease n=1 Tax=Oceanispirochaeta crateris TaxID=2518645 RepID=A0A5C1QSS6_9SPIO|nr:TRAP transporter small permease [Oceanispirochaeta crateris]QEN09656.1 TRAP transporter small permease [Oceanispirochaeta crateris]
MIDTQIGKNTSLITKIANTLYRSLLIIQTSFLGFLLILVTLQIISRLIPALPYMLWTEEISRFLLVWVIFLGAAIGVKENSHFTVSLLPEPKSKLGATIWELSIAGLTIIFAAIFTYRGYKYAKVMFWDISDIAQISMIWVGSAIPVFGILSLIFLFETVIKLTKKAGE